MNLTKLFETQRKFRERVNYQGSDRFEKLILALLVELGECANEWRGFKFWSKNQEPRKEVICHACNGECCFHGSGESITIDGVVTAFYEPCAYCGGTGVQERPLLEEYVDILHFLLEIGLEMKEMFAIEPLINHQNKEESHNITEQFNNIFGSATALHMSYHDDFYDNEDRRGIFEELFESFINLGQMLGFTWEEIEQAYYAKNKINHHRQDVGY